MNMRIGLMLGKEILSYFDIVNINLTCFLTLQANW